jgi:hypothetical protein
VNYDFGVLNAATVYALENVGGPVALFPLTVDDNSPVLLTLSPESLVLQPGATGNFTAVFSLQDGFDPSLVPVYSGYITINSSAAADYGGLHVPFLGVATDVSTLPILNTTGGLPTLSPLGAPNETITESTTAIFSMNGTDFPAVNIALVFPSRVLRLDVLPSDPNEQTDLSFAGLNILGYSSSRLI